MFLQRQIFFEKATQNLKEPLNLAKKRSKKFRTRRIISKTKQQSFQKYWKLQNLSAEAKESENPRPPKAAATLAAPLTTFTKSQNLLKNRPEHPTKTWMSSDFNLPKSTAKEPDLKEETQATCQILCTLFPETKSALLGKKTTN